MKNQNKVWIFVPHLDSQIIKLDIYFEAVISLKKRKHQYLSAPNVVGTK